MGILGIGKFATIWKVIQCFQNLSVSISSALVHKSFWRERLCVTSEEHYEGRLELTVRVSHKKQKPDGQMG